MKKLPGKPELRREIEAQVRDYLREGGTIEEVPRGLSGHEPGAGPPGSFHRNFQPRENPPAPRTPLHEVVMAIEARRKRGSQAKPATRKTPLMRRKPILDDFGEPVRWVWVEEDSRSSQ